MKEEIDKFSGIPYYLQLYNILLEKINTNKYKNHKLPSEYELVDYYKITKPTVRKTLSKLRQQGKIYTLRGVGTFIHQPKLNFELTKYLNFILMKKNKYK